jgi:tRNA threonylcarbamoyladenosine biosynthesis protein TsaB
MDVLALDTTTRAGSIALIVDHDLVEERRSDPSRTYAERLPEEMLSLLKRHDRSLADVDVFAVASGPGSFTGLRVGIATMQGAASATRRPLVSVSALDALAQMASVGLAPGARVAAWMDGYRRDVFTALYEVTALPPFNPTRLVMLEEPAVGDPVAALARWGDRSERGSIVFVGDGAVLYAETIREHAPQGSRVDGAPEIAGAIGRMAAVRAANGERPSPAAVRPLYVRRPDAEIARERSGR